MQSAVSATAAPADAAPGGGVCGGGGIGGGEGGDVVMAKRASLAACLTCPLCGRLLRDATTISECLHTFCRKCISAEFINKEACCCPTCNIDLGCAPLEKLRVDHSIQFVRSKIFPFKRKKVESPEVMSPIASPVKRKERSLSSLTIPAPQKYLVQKLNLSSETEVELLCAGKVVSQGMTLHDLADCWLEKGPKGRMRSSVGSPATGFMVTVFYRRPDVPSPPPESESCHG
ncbi:hypothetical protein GUJ93_ZPchr0013g36533 [Zizania palustris]|uniref:RING-type domain-containing protein n=1 Tax=Zizania palustris TaxID=103762 RepID=A0A8J5X6L8_ZIZPA|nr:hypothetical protein GUJ93_ZPchr0013g36533 [Zizania palustris]